MSRALLRRLSGAWLILQGVGVLAWWALLLLVPGSRELFRAATAPDATLLAFAVGDVLMVGILAILTGWGVLRQRAWSGPALLVVATASAYAALYCLFLPLMGDGSGWLAALSMAPLPVVPALIAFAWWAGLLSAHGAAVPGVRGARRGSSPR